MRSPGCPLPSGAVALPSGCSGAVVVADLHLIGGGRCRSDTPCVRPGDASGRGYRGTFRYGKISHVTESAPDPGMLLHENLSKEYYAILGVVSSYDGWLLIVKGWSVLCR
jgi:hypothetical protein